MAVAPIDPLEGFDVLAEFEKAMGEDLPDPIPLYDELRAVHPVYPGDLLTERLGLRTSTPRLWEGPPVTILGYEEVMHVMRDTEHFSNTVHERSVGKTMGRNLLTIDDPEHRVHRQLVQKAFSRRAMEAWRTEFVEPYVHRTIDEMLDQGRAELMSDFALTFPVSTIHYMLGLPPEHLMELHTLAVGLLLYQSRPDIAMVCSDRLGAMLRDVVQRRRHDPTDDVTSVLCQAVLETGESLSDEEVISFLRVMMPAGGETTTRTLGSQFALVLGDPEQLDLILHDRALIDGAIEETLRLESPTQYTYRLCIEDTEVAGAPIAAGSGVAVCLASANRDPKAFLDPGRFDVRRTGSPHTAFGYGTHVCLGMHLARMETSVAFRAFLDRMPNLRLDPDMPPPVIRGVTFRSPAAVHVCWD